MRSTCLVVVAVICMLVTGPSVAAGGMLSPSALVPDATSSKLIATSIDASLRASEDYFGHDSEPLGVLLFESFRNSPGREPIEIIGVAGQQSVLLTEFAVVHSNPLPITLDFGLQADFDLLEDSRPGIRYESSANGFANSGRGELYGLGQIYFNDVVILFDGEQIIVAPEPSALQMWVAGITSALVLLGLIRRRQNR